jgi:hypothetical protein
MHDKIKELIYHLEALLLESKDKKEKKIYRKCISLIKYFLDYKD